MVSEEKWMLQGMPLKDRLAMLEEMPVRFPHVSLIWLGTFFMGSIFNSLLKSHARYSNPWDPWSTSQAMAGNAWNFYNFVPAMLAVLASAPISWLTTR